MAMDSLSTGLGTEQKTSMPRGDLPALAGSHRRVWRASQDKLHICDESSTSDRLCLWLIVSLGTHYVTGGSGLRA